MLSFVVGGDFTYPFIHEFIHNLHFIITSITSVITQKRKSGLLGWLYTTVSTLSPQRCIIFQSGQSTLKIAVNKVQVLHCDLPESEPPPEQLQN